MSGIFKSVKKTLKKIGKVVKKIAPYLILAAGVYFGGSYLMSMAGGANAAQSASVATSFTKSAGVWKSFMGGLANGTASSSAAAFAEGSYVAMQGGLPLSAQVAAGTSAVQSLGVTNNVAMAVANGQQAGKLYNQSMQSGMSSTEAMQQALAGSPVTDATSSNVSGGATQQIDLTTNAPGGGLIAPSASADGSAHLMEGRTDAVTAADQAGGTVGGSNVPDTTARFGKPGGLAETMAQQSMDLRTQQMALSQTQHAETMKMYELSHQQNMMGMYMRGAGVLLNAYGQYSQTKADEKEKQRKLNWKPSGEEVDVVTPSLLQNPKGLIS
jgi:hypothetical protein